MAPRKEGEWRRAYEDPEDCFVAYSTVSPGALTSWHEGLRATASELVWGLTVIVGGGDSHRNKLRENSGSKLIRRACFTHWANM